MGIARHPLREIRVLLRIVALGARGHDVPYHCVAASLDGHEVVSAAEARTAAVDALRYAVAVEEPDNVGHLPAAEFPAGEAL